MDTRERRSRVAGWRDLRVGAAVLAMTAAACGERAGRQPMQDEPVGEARQEMLEGSAAWASEERSMSFALAWGDVDGDGDLDLAVGNRGYAVRVYGNDGGTLAPGAVWSSSEVAQTHSVAWGDVDSDGDLDLAVGNDGAPNRLYRNDGGTLGAEAVWSSAESADTYSVAWGDVNGDGDLDLAVGNHGRAPNRLHENDGGTLLPSATWSSSETGQTRSVAWGDVDGDGDLDLAVANDNDSNLVHRNDDGSLGTAALWRSSEVDNTTSQAWGDFNADGNFDLAVGNWDAQSRIYYSHGDTLALTWNAAAADPTHAVAWGDVDGDGDVDLAVGNLGEPNRVYVNVNITNTPAWSSTEQDQTNGVAWGDVDGDGDLDLAVANIDAPNRLYYNESATLGPSGFPLAHPPDTWTSVAWADIEGDGDLDLAVGNHGAGPNRVFRNDGGTLALVWSAAEAEDTFSVAWGDVDGDGDLDLAVGNHGEAPNRLYGNDGGMLAETAIWSSAEAGHTRAVAWGDVDGDGDLDLAVANDDGPNVLHRNEGGTLTTAAVWRSTAAGNSTSLAWGDVDGDGDLDLAVGNSTEPCRLYRNDGGALTEAASWSSPAMLAYSVAWGDVDGDGDLDLAVGTHGDAPDVLYENAGGTLGETAVWSSTEQVSANTIAWGDADGDGDLDLAVSNTAEVPIDGMRTLLYLNDGGSLATEAGWLSPQESGVGLAWADVDGDGDLDLSVGVPGSALRIYPNNLFGAAVLPETPVRPRVGRPGTTPSAAGYSSAERLAWPIITVPFVLLDHESDTAPLVRLQYSRQGGGQWLDANVTGATTGLAASPEGTAHSLDWNVQADEVVGDNIALRVLVEYQAPSHAGGPLQRPRVTSVSPTFRVVQCIPGAECCTETATFVADGTSCADDGLYCTGLETCQSGACVSSGDPCAANVGDGDSDCAEACDEDTAACGAAEPDGTVCAGGVCEGGTCAGGEEDDDCGCRMPGRPSSRVGASLVLFCLVLLLVRRRRPSPRLGGMTMLGAALTFLVASSVLLASCTNEPGGSGGAGGTLASGGGGTGGEAGNGIQCGGLVPTGRSCSGLDQSCGPTDDEDCCASVCVPGGSYLRSYDGIDFPDDSFPATVSSFALDRYEVTVGRFGAFVEAGMGTQQTPPAAGDGAHPLIAGSGWDAAWNSYLPADTAALKAGLRPDGSAGYFCTYEDTPGAGGWAAERAINCVTWFVAFAFCAWDGGRLPTEAEWNYAAAGAEEQRYYPWSSAYPPGNTTRDPTYANYCCAGPDTTCRPSCNPLELIDFVQPVDTRSPKGDGRWGHANLAGNVAEWLLDVFLEDAFGHPEKYITPCDDCAALTPGLRRVMRGGDFESSNPENSQPDMLRSAIRNAWTPDWSTPNLGVRCARTP
jgi:formylglycine-generating enzyme required for sulfatase activity